jgi:hypothetical protein
VPSPWPSQAAGMVPSGATQKPAPGAFSRRTPRRSGLWRVAAWRVKGRGHLPQLDMVGRVMNEFCVQRSWAAT